MRANLSLMVLTVLAGSVVAQAQQRLAPPVFSPVASESQVSMCVTTAIGTCGTFCEPFQCSPNYTLVSSFENMIFDVAGAPGSFYVLFAGVAVPGCLPVPGVAGEMATWWPAAAIHFGVFTDESHRSDLVCQPAVDQLRYGVPLVPPGVDVRFQLLGMNDYAVAQPMLTFSRATEVRTR